MKNPWLIEFLMASGLALIMAGCGVKGDPLPPETAPRLGRGHPTYTKASKQLTPDFQSSQRKKKDEEEKDKK